MNYGDLLFKEASPDQLKDLFVKYGIRAPGDIPRAIEIHGEVVSDEIDNILNDNFLGGKLIEKAKAFTTKMRNKKNSKEKNNVGIFQKVKDSQNLEKAKGFLSKNTSAGTQTMSAPAQTSSPKMGGVWDTLRDTVKGKKEEKAKKEAEALKEAENKKKTQKMLIIGGVALAVVMIVVLIVVNRK